MKLSDSQCAQLVAKNEVDKLTMDEVYKACALKANNGGLSILENQLYKPYIALLEARRALKRAEFSSVNFQLLKFHNEFRSGNIPSWLLGDYFMITASVHQRQGNDRESMQAMTLASDIFQSSEDYHRFLRARINHEIMKKDYNEFVDGSLYFLKFEALKNQFNDLSGHILKAGSVELLNQGQFLAAAQAAQDAVAQYEIQPPDPEDHAIALTIQAIAQWISGNSISAKECQNRISIRDGRVAPYFNALSKLMCGHIPEVAPFHPLHGTPWKSSLSKQNSITGKLISRLQNGKATRDQLIESIWGKEATHPSYCDRLYSAIKQVRKNKGVNIVFDGNAYHL